MNNSRIDYLTKIEILTEVKERPTTAAEIGREFNVAAQTIHSALTKLMEVGLIDRRKVTAAYSQGTHTVHGYFLTEVGEEVLSAPAR